MQRRRARRSPHPLALLAFAPLLATACAGGPTEVRTVYDPELVTAEQAKRDADARRRDLARGVLQIDQALDSYVQALSGSGIPSQDEKARQLERLLRQMVNGTMDGSSTTVHNPQMPAHLIALASDNSDRVQQGVALAAIGFLEDPQALSLMLSGAQLDDSFLVDRAVLGLAIRKDPRTPPGIIAAVMRNEKFPEQSRIQASWALYVVQQSSLRGDEIPPMWSQVLTEADTWHPLVVATAVRGLGLTREAKYAQQVLPFLHHPTTRVRLNAAVALGRMNAQEHHEALIDLLDPQETSPNVRLAARKALQALAGGVDRGYDVKLWRREFQRSDDRLEPPVETASTDK